MRNEAKPARKAEPDAVLDTCCLVNLAAVDGTLECLAQFNSIWHVPTAVQAEGIFIRAAADSREVRRIDLDPAMASGVVHICAPADDTEAALYVGYALSLDDGEAMALAIAKNRGWKLATDDRKAQVKAKEAGVVLVTIPELMHVWALRTGCAEMEAARTLRRIETLARFAPSDDSPAARWWRQIASKGSDDVR